MSVLNNLNGFDDFSFALEENSLLIQLAAVFWWFRQMTLVPLNCVMWTVFFCCVSGAGYLNGRDAFRKILKSEGVSGLYRGFSVYMASAFSGCCYILTYEYSKHWVR